MSEPLPSRDVEPAGGSPTEERPSAAALREGAARRSSWLLRVTALVAFVASIMGVIVAPGLRGLASDHVVDHSNRVAWTFAYLMSGLLMAAIVMGSFELTHNRVRGWPRSVVVIAGGVVMALAAPALVRSLPTPVTAGLAVATAITVLAAAWQGMRASHTRAVAIIMASFAMAGLVRVIAWELARAAGDAGNTHLYAVARGVATLALVFEALGQMIAAAWLGTRSRFGGQALSSLAIALAWIMTWSAARGALMTASAWEAVFHTALASASGLPQPYGPTILAPFLLAASILLAGVAAVQARQVVEVVVALSLSLLARGTFDVPLHALAATAAALWLTVTITDPRAMWRSLLAGREPRTAPPRPPRLAPPPA